MSLSYAQVKLFVHQRIKIEPLTRIINYVKQKDPSLWGSNKGERYFVQKMIYCTLYHDLYDLGFDYMINNFNFLNIYSKTLRHNIKIIRSFLSKWGSKKIDVGNVYVCNRNMGKRKVGNKIKDVNLLIDSCDFRISGANSTSSKSYDWSPKEKAPAQRYTVVKDGKGVVRKIW